MADRVIKLEGRGLRGESYADIARRSGLFGILPTDDDETVISKINADAAASAALAESAAGPTYDSIADGLAATSDGEAFAVSNGDGTVTIYLNDGGVAVEQRTLATTDYLASQEGATAVGLSQGGSIQDAIRWVTPRATGAVADGVADDTAAIQAAIDLATAQGRPLVTGEGTFRCTSTIYITCDFDGSDATFVYPDSYTGNSVVVGAEKNATPLDRLYRKKIILPNVTGGKSGSGWSSVTGSIGVLAINVMECDITIRDIYNCETGFKLHGLNLDCNYNKIHVDRIFQCRDSLVLHGQRTAAGGSCNQNTIIGGRYALDSGEGTRVPGTNLIRLIAEGSAVSCNNNTFINPSVEGAIDENAIKVEALSGGSSEYNTFYNPRFETGSAANKRILFSGANARRNTIMYGYGVSVDMMVEEGGASTNSVYGALGSAIRTSAPRPTFGLQTSSSSGVVLAAFSPSATTAQMVSGDNAHVTLSSTELLFRNGLIDTGYQLSINPVNGALRFADGANPSDVNITRNRPGSLLCSGVMGATGGFAVGNSAVATTPGTVTRRIEVFNSATGNSIGFIPVYDTIT